MKKRTSRLQGTSKPQRIRKLRIHRETLRRLEPGALERARAAELDLGTCSFKTSDPPACQY